MDKFISNSVIFVKKIKSKNNPNFISVKFSSPSSINTTRGMQKYINKLSKSKILARLIQKKISYASLR